MIGVVFLSLLLAMVAVVVVCLATFVDVAFAQPGNCVGAAPAPLTRGSIAPIGSFDGAGLAIRVERAVSRAVAKLGVKPAAAEMCNSACHQSDIQVTTPEVLAIVQELRDRQPPAQVEAIRTQALLNLLAPSGTHNCPLLMSGGYCACEIARPVSCRARCIAGADSPVQAKALAESLGTEVTDIFRDCLYASGLDGARYELNSALATVLKTPHAARRWARGEQILNATRMVPSE